MRPFIALLLIELLLAPMLIRLGVAVAFFSNQAAIAEEYCVNKDKPEMECNGKCHLQKMLTGTEAPIEQSLPKVFKGKAEAEYVVSLLQPLTITLQLMKESLSPTSFYMAKPLKASRAEHWHPPCFC